MHRHLFTHFGYCSMDSFICSLVRPTLTPLLLPIAAVGASFEVYLGLSGLAILALAILLTLELISGIAASYVEYKTRKLSGKRNQKTKWFSDKKLLGWGLKVFVLFFTLFFLTVFRLEYKASGQQVEESAFRYLHSLVVMYMTGVYIVSVYKNCGRITSNMNDYNALIKILKDSTRLTKVNPDIHYPNGRDV